MFIEKSIYDQMPFDNVIHKLIESGIISHWRDMVFRQKRKNDVWCYSISALSVHHMGSSLVIWSTGLLISLFVFGFEIYVHKKCMSNTVSERKKKIWLIASKMIDSKRYVFIIDTKN